MSRQQDPTSVKTKLKSHPPFTFAHVSASRECFAQLDLKAQSLRDAGYLPNATSLQGLGGRNMKQGNFR